MKSKLTLVLVMAVGLALGSIAVCAQDTPPPTQQTQQPAASPTPQPDRTWGGYNVSGNVEGGWRFFNTDGNVNKYRSDLNYDRGPRLMNLDFLARSKDDNGGGLFDFLQVSAQNWGGDPSAYLRVRAEKKKWYRFDGNYRKFDYFNNLASFDLGQHVYDTERRYGDFNLTLLPQNDHIKFNLGYSLDRNHGTSYTTYHANNDDYTIFMPVRDFEHEFRFGADAKLAGFDLSFLQGFRYFKDDSTYSNTLFNPGFNTTNTAVLNTLERRIPVRGDISFTRFSVHRMIAKKLDFTGRYVYSSATTNYTFYETFTGKDSSNNTVNPSQIKVGGTAKRPNGAGDVGLTFFATDKLTISDTFRVNNFRINGNDALASAVYKFNAAGVPLPTSPTLTNQISLREEGYRFFQNTIEADYKFSKTFMLHGGYRFGDRRLIFGNADNVTVGSTYIWGPETDQNNTHAVFVGFKAVPTSIWKVYADFERGTADNAFTRLGNYNYTNFRVRTNIKPTRTLLINGSFVTKENSNPSLSFDTNNPTGFGTNVRSRIFSTWADWTPVGSRFALSGGYTYTHIDTDADIVIPVNRVYQNGSSLYFVRNHYFFFNTRIQVVPRATLFVGYNINDDSGQGDRVSSGPTQLLSSYPLRFQSPEVKLRIKIAERVDWNAGYKYFDYKEKFFTNQNYRANTAYTSLRISF